MRPIAPLLLTLPVFLAVHCAGASSGLGPASGIAAYDVRLVRTSPPKLSVSGEVPVTGGALKMATSRPGDIPEVAEAGWPGLVTNLRVHDSAGRTLATESAGAGGWKLIGPHSGRVTLQYEVDYAPLAARGWPAPRESAFADASHFSLIGRSLFITTEATTSARVKFDLPRPWQAITPWRTQFAPVQDIVENLLLLTTQPPSVISAGDFRVQAVALGHWATARDEVRRVVVGVVPRVVALMAGESSGDYLIVLLPQLERGGESFRSSFAMTVDTPPSRENRNLWGHTIAHEIFHYWNGSRLRGADYAASQWVQEGFTEYAADVAMAGAGLIDEEEFRNAMQRYTENYARLSTPLDKPGTRKGPPLYSGGAIVAYTWNVMIRDATQGKRGTPDFLRQLWADTDHGARSYDERDLLKALAKVAPLDWEGFFRRYIRGTERLPPPAVDREWTAIVSDRRR